MRIELQENFDAGVLFDVFYENTEEYVILMACATQATKETGYYLKHVDNNNNLFELRLPVSN